MNRQEFDNSLYIKPSGREEKEAREKLKTRKFWVLAVPGGLLAAFIVCLVSGSGAAFFPAWGVVTFLIYGCSIPDSK